MPLNASPPSTQSSTRQHQPFRRRAAIMAGAVVTLLIVAVTGAALIHAVAQQRAQSRTQLHTLQAMWLCESALNRAAAKLQQDGSYTGEEWQTPANPPAQMQAGKAVIEIEKQKDGARRISVVATYPATAVHQIQHSGQRLIPAEIPADAEGQP